MLKNEQKKRPKHLDGTPAVGKLHYIVVISVRPV